MNVPVQLRVAAILLWVNGIGFGVFCIPAIRNVLMGRDIPMVMGFPAYGRGPFERIGIPTTVPLLAGFLLVCTLQVVAGLLLWGGSKVGAILALALLPAGAIFWWGFALPFGPIFAIISTLLMLLGWQSLG
jgi:hypothetical protein